ncbi:MAG TPA: DUF5615 family PIN-like protein [Candidatus Acidoferrum sp.]|jgi:predicted nuclease of predicted toxin-antitoxin system|nr:DUF5615 family PIN-like protein [Candidatus Acidoferrum sp.]
MKLKLDENLPESLLGTLESLGHDVDNVRLENLVGRGDPEVWKAAQASNRLFITQDLDFSDARKFAPGSHSGLLLLRMHLPGRAALARRLEEVFRTEQVERWFRCFVLVTDTKVRVRWPKDRPQSS